MNDFWLKLDSVEKVEKLVNIISKESCDFYLRNLGRSQVVDPNSILGVLSLDLNEIVVLEHNFSTFGEIQDFYKKIKEFIVDKK